MDDNATILGSGFHGSLALPTLVAPRAARRRPRALIYQTTNVIANLSGNVDTLDAARQSRHRLSRLARAANVINGPRREPRGANKSF
jgi:hypothetical protein